MIGYVTQKLWSCAAPTDGKELEWICHQVLRINDISVETVYLHYQRLRPIGHPYLDRWNAARADVVAHYIDPPFEQQIGLTKQRTQLWPPRKPGRWLAQYLLGFTDKECSVLCATSDLDEPLAMLPLLLSAYGVLRHLLPEHELLSHYHRTRYLLLRYYLDARFHAIG